MDNWTWTDELVLEFERFTNHDAPTFQGRYTDLEQFKQSKQNSNKDWVIVRLKQRDGKLINVAITNNDKYLSDRIKTWNELGVEIYSVRRMSDIEVFSVGDDFYVSPGYKNHKIRHFIIDGNSIAAVDDIKYYLPHLMKRSASPLFTTEDGKDIYEGDEYLILFIESGSSWIPSKTKANEHTIADVTKSYMKRFSTEELAKGYAIMHKPCLSLDDLLSAWGDGDGKPKEYYANAPLFLNFKKLVNKRLNDSNR